VSLLEVSVAAGASGPVLVLAGEADVTSVTRLDEVLTARISGQAVQLTIDATNLRYADSASVTTLAMAAKEVRTRNGSVTLLNPQPAEARILDLLRAGEMFGIRRRAARETQPDTSAPAADGRLRGRIASPFGSERSIVRTGRASRTASPACHSGGNVGNFTRTGQPVFRVIGSCPRIAGDFHRPRGPMTLIARFGALPAVPSAARIGSCGRHGQSPSPYPRHAG